MTGVVVVVAIVVVVVLVVKDLEVTAHLAKTFITLNFFGDIGKL